jgi:Big-like domain-containing protein
MKIFIRCALVTLLVTGLLIAAACGGETDVPEPTTPPTSPATTEPATPTSNQPPVIESLIPQNSAVLPGGETIINCTAADPEGDTLTYGWSSTGGTMDTQSEGSNWTKWKAGDFTGTFQITVTVDDGHGNSVSRSVDMPVQDNLPPVIDGVTAAPAAIFVGETSVITCAAVDPEGAALTYAWRSDEGSISGTGSVVTWKSPDADGEYTVSVIVTDTNGAATTGTVKIGVQSHGGSVTLLPLDDKGGSVDAVGGILSGEYHVGDTGEDEGIRAYFNFDISSLSGYEIEEARLVFTVRQTVGDPWSFVPPFMYVQSVDYGERALAAADYTNISTTGAIIIETKQEAPGEANVTFALNRMLVAKDTRYQVRVSMSESGQHNYNGAADYVEFEKAELIVKYVQK